MWAVEQSNVRVSRCRSVLGGRIGSPVLFVNLTRDLRVTIHGDDITALGSDSDLKRLKQQLESWYELKYGGMLGRDEGDVQDAMVLNRLIHYDAAADETTYGADPRHVKILVKELGLEEAKGVASPGVNRKDDESELLDAQMCSRYRSLDRPDIHYSAKEFARKMSAPTTEDWASLKRLVRFLKSRPRLVWVYKQQGEQEELRMFSDSDDGGCSRARKSTSSGTLMHGCHLIKAYSST